MGNSFCIHSFIQLFIYLFIYFTFSLKSEEALSVVRLKPSPVRGGGGGGGGYLGQVLLSVCCWPLRTPTPLWSILWPTTDPVSSHFWANVIVISRTEFNANRLLNIETTAGTIFNRESSYF